ncbi:growth arrest and DNA damage-inducible protein GADD45 beta-like [Ostrea edulis]|uniref:growth arrest and DNA damage-inducible protein GADD45 beta-like n=1 Tax=Ostrea edulis TaxID=37623 RepID=UPI002094FC93|nr:growth arrest and DNA damage-inducible protein GADD45 beta-like [Ostrea edulis]
MNSAKICRMAEAHPIQRSVNIGQALKDTLLQALAQGRLVLGVMSSAKLLEVNPESVMVCILPASVPSHDVTFHIQQTLVEAFCVEHGIPILKICDSEKLALTLAEKQDSANNNSDKQEDGEKDLTCVLVQNPEVRSSADQFVIEFCEMIFLPHPRIELPV